MRRIFVYLAGLFGIKNKRKTKPDKVKNLIVGNYSQEKINQILRELENHMQVHHPYLATGYNIKSLAQELGMPGYQLSAFLNRQMGVNFNDYLNQYRIAYCKELIHNGTAGSLNLKGLATKCGFHNRNTFTLAFKKFTGYTPSFYIKEFKLNNIKSGKVVAFRKIKSESQKEVNIS